MYKTLSYASCNMSTIISFSIVFSLMVMTIIIMKLFIDGEIYKDQHGCWPISMYFGEVNGCKRLIYDTVNVDGFKTMNNTNMIQESFNFIYVVIKIFIENIKWILNGFRLFGMYIVEMNEFIKSYIYQFAKEKVSFIYI